MQKIMNLYYRIKHVVTYIPTLWNLYDFDAESLNTFSLAFFKRLKYSLVNGYAEHEPQHLKALDLIIKLLETAENTYFMDKHRNKWGKINMVFTDGDGVIFAHPNANTKEEIEECDKEFSKMYSLDEYMKDKKIRLAYLIYIKYYRYLWD